jgi:predicted metal-dependent HD superfamily phosphohydrolase
MRVIEPPPVLITDLKTRYREPQRAYHSWSHIEALLNLYDQYKGMLRDPTRVLWAIYWHDAVYDPMAKDNEERSAALLRTQALGLLPDARIVQIEKLILATIKHELPEGLGFDVQHDCAVFLDLDLSILAMPDELFDEYERGVRKEYAHVPEEAYRAARKGILERFLNREKLYFSPMLARQWEMRARANLKRSIEQLSKPVPQVVQFTPAVAPGVESEAPENGAPASAPPSNEPITFPQRPH